MNSIEKLEELKKKCLEKGWHDLVCDLEDILDWMYEESYYSKPEQEDGE